MMPPDFHFIRPLWLLALIPLLLLLWRLARSQTGGDAWRGLVDEHLLSRLLSDDGGRVRRLPLALLGLGWLLGVLALAGPTWQRLPQPVYQAEQYRVLALDLSPSMNATDMPPSRLAHARFELQDLLRKASEGQTALLAYGAEPFVVAPLTSDTDTIAAQVPSLTSALLPVRGDRRTDLVLKKAGELLRQAGAPDGEVILLTDGLDHPAAAYEAARELRGRGYTVSVLGMGTDKGAPVALADGGFLKDTGGAILLPKLDRDALSELASVGAGRFVTAGLDDRDIEALIPSKPDRLAQQSEAQKLQSDQWREAGPWLLLVLLPLAALAFRRGWLGPLVLVLFIMPPPPAQAFTWQDLWLRPDQQAVRDYQAGRHAEAAERFQRPDWRAAAEYESGDFEQALQSLDGLNGPQAAYNKGNTLARLGQLEDALKAYDQALEANPNDEDARHNRELVQKLLEQQQQNQQQSGQQGEQDQSAQQNGQQGEQDQSDQQNGQQGEQQPDSGQEQQDQQSASSEQAQQGQEGEQQQSGEQHQEQSSGEQAQQDQQPGEQGQQAEEESHDAQAQAGDKEEEREDSKVGEPQSASKEQTGDEKEARESASATPAEADSERARENQTAAEPELSDLLGGEPGQGQIASSAAESNLDPEDRQALEQMLRRVEDDPAGLLRQRFLLQHLRRSGQLP